jgi:hypothetical protein
MEKAARYASNPSDAGHGERLVGSAAFSVIREDDSGRTTKDHQRAGRLASHRRLRCRNGRLLEHAEVVKFMDASYSRLGGGVLVGSTGAVV